MGRPSLRRALAEAKRLGVPVEPKRRTGEVLVRFPGNLLVVNARKKDAPRALNKAIDRLRVAQGLELR